MCEWPKTPCLSLSGNKWFKTFYHKSKSLLSINHCLLSTQELWLLLYSNINILSTQSIPSHCKQFPFHQPGMPGKGSCLFVWNPSCTLTFPACPGLQPAPPALHVHWPEQSPLSCSLPSSKGNQQDSHSTFSRPWNEVYLPGVWPLPIQLMQTSRFSSSLELPV